MLAVTIKPTFNIPTTIRSNSRNGKRREKLFKRQNGRCKYCDGKLESPHSATIDHIVPKHQGGKGGYYNTCLVCPHCNALKGHISSLEEAEEYTAHLLEFFKMLREKGIC